ncbi:uncharacterized protein LOC132617100 [Lycium barbarum]|uniref:uncharacterized protein LOC132617100 n=1 Tax=Lycium barbarum TaxID=112863 RepID=UPI00293EA4F2|nr:uncharacterized protein LOC132617100 [Lycium barbarum]
MAEAIMTIEEHTNSSSASATKKLKQKKVPQRGLGVAQLERIRLEEQHTKDEILPLKNSIVSSQDSSFSTLKSPSALKNCGFRLNSSTPFLENLSLKDLQSPKQVNVSEGEMNLSAILGNKGYDDCSKLCGNIKYSCEEDQDEKLYQHGVVIQPPIFSIPQYQQPACSSSMMNISSGISSSSVRNYQMEPPSNQSYQGCYLPLWPEEVKRVGLKRPYPFPPEFPPVPAFHCKFPPHYEGTANSDSTTFFKREVPLKSRALFDLKPRNVVRENRALNGDFLTLAPPAAIGAENQQTLSNSAPRNNERFKFETVPFQEVAEEPGTRSGLHRSVQQHVFRFFPSPNVQIGQAGNRNNYHGEVGGKVDLNLKL